MPSADSDDDHSLAPSLYMEDHSLKRNNEESVIDMSWSYLRNAAMQFYRIHYVTYNLYCKIFF